MESKTIHTLDRRIIKNFMDIIVLKQLKNNHPMSGYDIIKFLHRRFQILPSPGTVYSLLYKLERKDLIEGCMNQGKRVYELTNQGEKRLKELTIIKNYIQTVVSTIFSRGLE